MRELNPYDTGAVLEPRPWPHSAIDGDEDFGKVDFDDESGHTICIVKVVRDPLRDRGYFVEVYDFDSGVTTLVAVGA